MKVLVVKNIFNELPIGSIIQTADELPNNHLANEGFIALVEVPEGVSIDAAKTVSELVTEKWVKGAEEVLTKPLVEEIKSYSTVNDNSWDYHESIIHPDRWFDGETELAEEPEIKTPSMYKIDGVTIPEKWTKDGETVYEQPVMQVPVTEMVPDESYVHIPAHNIFSIVEDLEKKEVLLLAKEEQKYVKRIDYAKNIIGKVSLLNSKKALTVEQVVQLSNTYAPIKGLLETGSYPSAYQMIQAIEPDGIITAEDKIIISDMIQTYLSSEG